MGILEKGFSTFLKLTLIFILLECECVNISTAQISNHPVLHAGGE
jgi:hypothetical protein